MPIYTKTGDKGQTSLFDGTRVPKSHIRVNAYGTIDELNSIIGVVISNFKRGKSVVIKKELEKIQHDLLEIGSGLAMPAGMPVPGLDLRVKEFEILIDQLTNSLPPLDKFILPGGSKVGALMHFARTVSRRAERRIVHLIENEEIDNSIVVYINRLSDLLFTFARHENYSEGIKENLWIKK